MRQKIWVKELRADDFTELSKKCAGKIFVGRAPEGFLEESRRLARLAIEAERAEALERLRHTTPVYDCSVCLIIRDESEYLEEWLRWHIGQGVQHFYIYAHGSKEPVLGFVRSLGLQIADKVTVIDWSGPHKHAQSEAYNHCLKQFGAQSRWIGFIDADEQVRVTALYLRPELCPGLRRRAVVVQILIFYITPAVIGKSRVNRYGSVLSFKVSLCRWTSRWARCLCNRRLCARYIFIAGTR